MKLKNKITYASIYWQAILLLFSVTYVSAVFQTFSEFKHSHQSQEIQPIEEDLTATPIEVNGVLYKTVKKYYCSLWNDEESVHTIVYGQKGWTFKSQDVNLTLAYPSKEMAMLEDYIITGYQVALFTDGTEYKAYISSGGLLQDSISLTFICSSITTVSYQFWLYGAHRSSLPSKKPVNLCE